MDNSESARYNYSWARVLSRSPLRSAGFLFATLAYLGCIALLLVIIIWEQRNLAAVVTFGLIGFIVSGLWWRVWRQLERLRQLHADGEFSEVETESSSDIALRAAVKAPTDLLLNSFCAIAMLLGIMLRLIISRG